MPDGREFHTIVLAGLVHDIGVFLRMGRSPEQDGSKPSADASAEFIDSFADAFAAVSDLELLRELVRGYRQPSSSPGPPGGANGIPRADVLRSILAKADALSVREPETPASGQGHKLIPLASLFPRVFAGEGKASALSHHVLQLSRPETLDKRIFPSAFREYPPAEMKDAIRAFETQAVSLLSSVGHDPDTLISHLLALLTAHTWLVPADTGDDTRDVSLYDHLRTTAAIAACLYRLDEAGEYTGSNVRTAAGRESFCLAVGDVSGIQDYIFSVASGAAIGGGLARRLRARSLFVQLISEVAPLQILRQLELPVTNLLMSSGGKFYLLLPNLEEMRRTLTSFQEQADAWFLGELNASLALNLSWVSFGERELQSFGGVIGRAMTRLTERKEQRFREALVENGRWLEADFLRPPFAADQQGCPSCGMFSAPMEADRLCPHCSKDREWGALLRACRQVRISARPSSSARDLIGAGVDLGQGFAIGHESRPFVLSINDPDTSPAASVPAAFRYLATYTPTTNGDSVTFEEIAAHSKGRDYLAFLKADVDRLGEVFAFGLKGRDSVSHLVALSRQIDLFFAGWVQHLLCTDFRSCYTVFSGGDDLFLVGPWDVMLRFAERLRDDFDDFVGHNPDLTLSAGLVIRPPRYPISQAAREAEEALEKSKQSGRNRITVLEHTLTWADWDATREQWTRLSAEGVKSAFLYSLLDYARMWRDYRRGDVLGLRFQPLLSYSVSRNVDARKDPALHQWARQLVEFRPGDHARERTLDNLGLLAQLLILGRKGGNE